MTFCFGIFSCSGSRLSCRELLIWQIILKQIGGWVGRDCEREGEVMGSEIVCVDGVRMRADVDARKGEGKTEICHALLN